MIVVFPDHTHLLFLNIFIANIKQGVGPQVFPTLVTTLPLQHTYKSIHKQRQTCFYLAQGINVRIKVFLLKQDEGNGNEDKLLDGTCLEKISIFKFQIPSI